MTFYEKYLKGIEWGKFWPVVGIPVTGLYNWLVESGLPRPVAAAVSAVSALVLSLVFLIIPKSAPTLAADPNIVAETLKSASMPVAKEVQKQVADAVTDTVENAKNQVQDAAEEVTAELPSLPSLPSLPAGLDIDGMATRLERAAAVLRGAE